MAKEKLQEIMKPKKNPLLDAIAAKPISPAPVSSPMQEIKPAIPEVIRNQNNAATGLKTPQGDYLLGLRPDETKAMAAVYAGQQAPIPGTLEASEVLQEAAAIEQANKLQTMQQQAFRDQQPTTNLNAEPLPLTQYIPGGKLAYEMGTQLSGLLKQGAYSLIPEQTKQNLIAAENTNPNFLRGELIKSIQKTESEKELTIMDRWGAVLEAIPTIPIIGGVKKYLGNPDTPSEQVKEIKNQMTEAKEYVIAIRKGASSGAIDPLDAVNKINEQQRKVEELEEKMQSMLSQSVELRGNPEVVNTIKSDILTMKQIMLISKITAMAGQKSNPTTEELLYQLNDLEKSGVENGNGEA